MKNFFKKQREVMALLAYFAIIAGLVYGVIFPLLARINNINDQIQQETMKQESVRLHIAELPKIQKQYEILQESGDVMNVLLDKNKAVILIEKLEKLAENAGCNIKIAVQDSNKGPAVKKTSDSADANSAVITLPADYLLFGITLSGDYNSVIRFISLLEKFEYYSDIFSIQINKDDSGKISSNNAMFGSRVDATAIKENIANMKVPGNSDITASLSTVFYIN